MLVLGIDPGSRKTGFALIEYQGRKVIYHNSGVLEFDENKEFNSRLAFIHSASLQLIEKYSPQEVAIESLIYVKDPTALMKLAQARGAMISAFAKTHDNKIFEYSPNSVKQATVGYGHATKENIQKFLQLIIGVKSFKTHDESDAIAVAICHIFNRRTK